MSNQLVSIVVPIYNVADYLSRTLSSIIRQSYKNIEIILVDDGSTDDSLLICSLFADKDKRIQIVHQENKGVSNARNAGIEISKGPYIAFIDGDDIIAPYYIERLVMSADDNALVRCSYKRVSTDVKNDNIFGVKEDRFEYISATECAKRILEGRFPISVWGCLFKRDLIGDLRFPEDIRSGEDKWFLFSYLLQNREKMVAFSNEKMYGHCIREGSASSILWNGSKDGIWVSEDIHKKILQCCPEWIKISQCSHFAALFSVLKSIIRSGAEETLLYRDIKEEILKMPLPDNARIQLKIEYCALKLGLYKALVKIYYGISSDYSRYMRNDRNTRSL